jgi:HSP20 family protein
MASAMSEREEIPMLMRTDPFRELDRLAHQAFATSARPAAMPIDAYRLEDSFVVELDLPGVDPASIDLTVEKNVLTVHARRDRGAVDGVEYLIGERPHGTFSRQLFLGDSLDTDRIDARYDDGVLKIQLPVAERAKPRKIEVAGGGSAPVAIDATSDELVESGT